MAEPVVVPPAARSLNLLDRVDYEDAHVAKTNQTLTADEWGQLILELAPHPMLLFARLVHRWVLGLKISAPSPDRPMGWNRLDQGADAYVLTADGPPTSARIIGFVTSGGVGLATQILFRSERTRLSWVLIAPIHRAFARSFLDRAVADAARNRTQTARPAAPALDRLHDTDAAATRKP